MSAVDASVREALVREQLGVKRKSNPDQILLDKTVSPHWLTQQIPDSAVA